MFGMVHTLSVVLLAASPGLSSPPLVPDSPVDPPNARDAPDPAVPTPPDPSCDLECDGANRLGDLQTPTRSVTGGAGEVVGRGSTRPSSPQ